MELGTRRKQRVGATFLGGMLALFATTAWAQTGGYQSDQGTHLHGTMDRQFEPVTLLLSSARYQGVGFQQVEIDRGELVGTWQGSLRRGDQFRNVSFSAEVGDQLVTFKIVAAQRHANVYTDVESSTVWEYQVEWSSPARTGNLCPKGSWALVLPGRWKTVKAGETNVNAADPDARMNVLIYTQPDAFSFACRPVRSGRETRFIGGGVAAKCVDWGYAPWLSADPMPRGAPVVPATSIVEAFEYHAACTAMAMADYCGEGTPNTLHGTPLIMFNKGNVETQVEPEDPLTKYVSAGPFGADRDFFFESAWTATPVYVSDPTGESRAVQGKALCLTKKRWSTLKYGGSCSYSLPDPRQREHEPFFCEQLSADELIGKGSRLFSYSTYIDKGLYRFKKSQTNQFLTTALAATAPNGDGYVPQVEDAEEYVLDLPHVQSFEGNILGPNVPHTFPVLQSTQPLLRYRSTSGKGFLSLVMGVQVPEGYEPDGIDNLEGYVYVGPNASMTTPVLSLWYRQKDEAYATSTRDLSAWDYTLVEQMGYLPSMNEYARMP
ncbi:ADYC domain-containing protein [Archangium lipolyticum]|uniref:ADYC domain-containing protein n=1 Tax=Archangium lipolyticum TaxID=2970465 RepID=UPI00214A7336|nr:ADYC domain-containing protein [Archangium lipolyticum]